MFLAPVCSNVSTYFINHNGSISVKIDSLFLSSSLPFSPPPPLFLAQISFFPREQSQLRFQGVLSFLSLTCCQWFLINYAQSTRPTSSILVKCNYWSCFFICCPFSSYENPNWNCADCRFLSFILHLWLKSSHKSYLIHTLLNSRVILKPDLASSSSLWYSLYLILDLFTFQS